jgi:hypothetical protein
MDEVGCGKQFSSSRVGAPDSTLTGAAGIAAVIELFE